MSSSPRPPSGSGVDRGGRRVGAGEALLERLRGVELLARGPKVKGAVRAAGLTEEWSPSSESMAEVLDRLLEEGVEGRRVALQLHGEPLPGFVEALRAGERRSSSSPCTGGCRRRTSLRWTGCSTRRSRGAWTHSRSPARRPRRRCCPGPRRGGCCPNSSPPCTTTSSRRASVPSPRCPSRTTASARSSPSAFGSARSSNSSARSFPGGPVPCPSPAPGGDPGPCGAGGRGATARAAGWDVVAQGAVPSAGVGGGPGGTAAGASWCRAG